MAEYHVYNGTQLAAYLHNAAGAAPGDKIWCHQGVYTSPAALGNWDPILAGTQANPIQVRAMPWERVQIVGPRFICSGADVWYWGLEFTYLGTETRISTQTGSDPTDQPARMVMNITGDRVKLINSIIHATNGGVGYYASGLAIDAEMYGCLCFNNGWQGADRGNGNSAYIQSSTGEKKITNCLGWNSFGPGFKGYGRTAAVQGIRFTGCMAWGAGAYAVDTPGQYHWVQNIMAAAEDNPPTGIVAEDCTAYHIPGVYASNMAFSTNSAAQGGTANATGNHLIGGAPLNIARYDSSVVTGNKLFGRLGDLGNDTGLAGFSQDSGGLPPGAVTWHTNDYFDQTRIHSSGFRQPFVAGGGSRRWSGIGSFGLTGWREFTPYDATGSTYTEAVPTGFWTRIRPNAYEAGRAHIGVFNPGLAASVSVDISSAGLLIGQPYQVHDVQNLFGAPVLTGTYTGANITLPMTMTTVARVLGMTWEPAHTAPEFAVFLLRAAPSGGGPDGTTATGGSGTASACSRAGGVN